LVKKNVLGALAALRVELSRLEAETRDRTFNIAGLVIPLETPDDPCPKCGGPMLVQKSLPHRVVTLEHGSFIARETIRVCSQGCTSSSGTLLTRRSELLPRWVGRGAVYGYDIEVYVGTERFVHHRQREEIRRHLKDQYAIALSTGEVSMLASRFLEHLEALHHQRSRVLRGALDRDGGYPLHIDATGEDGRGTLFVAYAGWRDWVLGSWKISTERADLILPHLREVSASFGAPCAVLRDLGRAVIQAAQDFIKELGRDIPAIGCHLHFLSDVGEDLLEASHDKLRNLFRRYKIRPRLRTLARDLGRRLGSKLPSLLDDVTAWTKGTTEHQLPEGPAGLAAIRSLAQWVLDYASSGDHLGFPFDQPYLDLYERCRTARRAADAFLRRPVIAGPGRRYLRRLARILDSVIAESSFSQVANTVSCRAKLFDELRGALRLSPKSSAGRGPDQNAIPPTQASAELRDIRKSLNAFTRALRKRRPERGPAQDSREAIDIILDHLDRHGKSLWGHVIHLRRAGGGIRVVARTNNQLEGFFHQMKHGERRRSGRKVLSRDFEVLPAGAALAINLTHPDYVRLLCGSLDKLPEAFAMPNQARRTRDRATSSPACPEPETSCASFPRADRRMVRAMPLRRFIESAARSRAPRLEMASG
jgi:hypothetical protein